MASANQKEVYFGASLSPYMTRDHILSTSAAFSHSQTSTTSRFRQTVACHFPGVHDDEQDVHFCENRCFCGQLYTITTGSFHINNHCSVAYLMQHDPSLLGIVNDQFSQIRTLKSKEEPDCAVWLINMYFIGVETILSKLTSYSELPDVDYSRLAVLAREIQEKSSRIGAEHVRCACNNLIQACDQMHKQNFILALDWIKNEFCHTRNKLESFVQMERKLIRLESKSN